MESVVRGVLLYVVLLVIMRLSGRRTVAQMTPFDFVLILIVAETTQQALLGDDFSITNAAILVVTLFGADILLSYVKQRWRAAERLMDGVPVVLIARGKPDERALARSRVQLEDVMEAARAEGLERLDQIKFAVMEISGKISIIPDDDPGG